MLEWIDMLELCLTSGSLFFKNSYRLSKSNPKLFKNLSYLMDKFDSLKIVSFLMDLIFFIILLY
jgi:hypothetical protein